MAHQYRFRFGKLIKFENINQCIFVCMGKVSDKLMTSYQIHPQSALKYSDDYVQDFK